MSKRPKKYHYTLMTLADAKPSDQVLVPNCSSSECVEIWRYLSGKRKDFPEFNDGSLVIVGLDEEAWCYPREYRENYAPPTMTCIVRNEATRNS
jgi:hypothetical protein